MAGGAGTAGAAEVGGMAAADAAGMAADVACMVTIDLKSKSPFGRPARYDDSVGSVPGDRSVPAGTTPDDGSLGCALQTWLNALGVEHGRSKNTRYR